MIINETTKSLEEQVYRNLEEDILSGYYSRGESLTEMTLCKKLGVSRTPVRSALHRLYEEGLVEISPNRGAVVIGVAKEDLTDAYKIRMRLEGLASAMATERMTDEEKNELKETLELSEFYLTKGDTESILNRPAEVAISNTSGLAGIAYWINKHYHLPEFRKVTKQDEIVIKAKEFIDRLYEDGRTTLLGDEEMLSIIEKVSPQPIERGNS